MTRLALKAFYCFTEHGNRLTQKPVSSLELFGLMMSAFSRMSPCLPRPMKAHLKSTMYCEFEVRDRGQHWFLVMQSSSSSMEGAKGTKTGTQRGSVRRAEEYMFLGFTFIKRITVNSGASQVMLCSFAARGPPVFQRGLPGRLLP